MVSLATPATAAAVSAAVLVLGLAGGLVLRGTIAGRVALAVGLVAWPAAVAATVFAAGAPEPWTARAGLTAAALLLIPVVVLAGRAARPYAVGALALAVGVATTWPDLTGVTEPQGIYPALGLVILATAYRAVRPHGKPLLGVAAGAEAVVLLPVLLPLALVLFAAPYEWAGSIWSGAPDGVGIDPADVSGVPRGSSLTALLVAGAIALVGRYAVAAAVGLVGVVAVLAGFDAPWPTVPAASLALGAGAVVVTTLWGRGGRYVAPVGLLLAGAGLAGLLPTEASTLAGLGLIAVAAAVVGGAGPATGARVAGWLVAVVAAGSFAAAATRAADLPLARAAYPVLAVGAVALGLAALLRTRRVERIALDAAAHTTAVVALLLTIGEPRHAAAICTLWGAAVAVRAVAPGEQARRALALGAAGSVLLAWWLLLASERVALPEAYTLPAAALALVAGHLALRARPGIGSWVGYGPGLAAALLPSLASILVADGQGLRRLLLGAGALLVVLAGAREKRQAPFVVGGVTLLAVAAHEIVVWDLLPRWGYLAIGGLVLIAVAMTYERRLRDLRRLRGTIASMS